MRMSDQKFMLFDTKSNEKRVFQPIDSHNIGMYVCGPTVYDKIHIGNARPLVIFDMVYRLLRYMYHNKVTYVRNITDIDDKINHKASQLGISIFDLTQTTAQYFCQECHQLYCLPPTYQPKATDHIDDILALIEKLVSRNHAYIADNHVVFDISSMKNYGELSHRSLEDLIAGARVDVASYKKNAGDFVLWKPSNESKKNEPGWHSPYGFGRPGWHIECSAMSLRYLGKNFDIHAGGQDLIFPHHENEIAQTCCAFDDATFANYWMHNGYVMVEGQKMSKSLGNFITIHDLLKDYHGEIIRLSLLMTHYRQPLNFTTDRLNEAKIILNKAYRLYQKYGEYIDKNVEIDDFISHLQDDLNTPSMLTLWQEWAQKSGDDVEYAVKFIKAGQFMGLFNLSPEEWFHQTTLDPATIECYIQQRTEARQQKNFKKADEIRQYLLDQNIILEDNANGTLWRKQ